MIIGGQAVILHGVPRVTEDVDVTLGVDRQRLPDLLAACREMDLAILPDDVETFVRDTNVLAASDADSGIRVDFIFSTIPYEREAIERAVHVRIKGTSVPFASVEDLILHKLFAGRPRDMEDVDGILRSGDADIDWAYLERWSEEFAVLPGREDMPETVRELRAGRRSD